MTRDNGRRPKTGETVIYFNRHGFPRAALVTGTAVGLVGEKHVEDVISARHVHLTVFSPLPRTYHEQNVPHLTSRSDLGYTEFGNAGCWAWPDEVQESL